jgi:hypothetical protein
VGSWELLGVTSLQWLAEPHPVLCRRCADGNTIEGNLGVDIQAEQIG